MGDVIRLPVARRPEPQAPLELVVLAGMLSVFLPVAVVTLMSLSVSRALKRAF